jgi:hypothetical protein
MDAHAIFSLPLKDFSVCVFVVQASSSQYYGTHIADSKCGLGKSVILAIKAVDFVGFLSYQHLRVTGR